MTEVIPGIHQLQIPILDNPLGNTNSYLVRGNNENLLIDPGFNTDEAFNSLKNEISETGISIKDITQVLSTHSHSDHYGLSERLKQVTKARILLHERDINLVNPWGLDWTDVISRITQWFIANGVPENVATPPSTEDAALRRPPSTPPDVILHGGENISIGAFNLQVIWTPGHSPGHVCLYEPDLKILFSGDHVLPGITPNIGHYPQSGDNPLGDFLKSLNRVKQLDINLALPAHEHIFTNLQTRVYEIIHHHELRNSEILETIKSEPKTAYQISTEVTWMPGDGGVEFHDLTQWDRRMATAETMAHLEAMRFDGQVDKSLRDSIIYYRAIK